MPGIVDINNVQICQNQNQLIPPEGPRALPINLDFSTDASQLLDTSMLMQRAAITIIQCVFIDNSGNPNPLTIDVQDGGQRIVAAPNTQGYYTILVPNPAKLLFTSVLGAGARVFCLNSPVSGSVWSTI